MVKLIRILLASSLLGGAAYYFFKVTGSKQRIKVFPIQHKIVGFQSRFDLDNHRGIDIFAPQGAPIVAVADGKLQYATEPKGGNAAYLTTADGTQFYYAHMQSTGKARNVVAGEQIGNVGTTGNAQGRDPHLHFEYRPRGGINVDPFTELEKAKRIV